jgi:peroxiredoxin
MTMPLMETLQKEYADSLVLLAINVQETPEEVRSFVRAQSLHSRVLLDEEGSIGATYGADSIPMQVLIDKKGIVRHIQIGYSPSTAAQLRKNIQKLQQQS